MKVWRDERKAFDTDQFVIRECLSRSAVDWASNRFTYGLRRRLVDGRRLICELRITRAGASWAMIGAGTTIGRRLTPKGAFTAWMPREADRRGMSGMIGVLIACGAPRRFRRRPAGEEGNGRRRPPPLSMDRGGGGGGARRRRRGLMGASIIGVSAMTFSSGGASPNNWSIVVSHWGGLGSVGPSASSSGFPPPKPKARVNFEPALPIDVRGEQVRSRNTHGRKKEVMHSYVNILTYTCVLLWSLCITYWSCSIEQRIRDAKGENEENECTLSIVDVMMMTTTTRTIASMSKWCVRKEWISAHCLSLSLVLLLRHLQFRRVFHNRREKKRKI